MKCGPVLFGAASALLLLGSRPAAALEESDPELRRRFDDLPWHAEAIAGFSTLVGSAGVTFGYNVHDRVELGGGAGTNWFGLAGGGYVRLRPLVHMAVTPRRLHALSVDAGFSVSRYRDVLGGILSAGSHDDPDPDADSDNDGDSPELTHWLQLELSWETWSRGGFTLRLGGGAVVSVADGPDTVVLPAFTVALGHAF